MNFKEEMEKQGLMFGRSVGSKSGYREHYPNDFVIFNARIYDEEIFEKEKDGAIRDFFKGQELELWFGDINVSRHLFHIVCAAFRAGQNVVITNERGTPFMKIFGGTL